MNHRTAGAIVHITAAAAIAAIVLLTWWRQDARLVTGEQDRNLGELAAVLGQAAPTVDDLTRRLESLTSFPPASEATAAIARVVAACNLARLEAEQRLRLVRGFDAVMNGGYLTAGALARAIEELRRVALVGCGPEQTAALVAAAHRAARDVANPRRDWW